jgi:fatty aldehyde decarbonylase
VQQLPIDESKSLSPAEQAVYADALSQAITGEWVGMQNYAALAAACTQPDLAAKCVAHAASERRHALRLRECAQRLNLRVIENPQANYWGQLRAIFMRYAAASDLIACFVIQEVLLESLAVALYGLMAQAAPGELGRLFASLRDEEAEHAEQSEDFLTQKRNENPHRFDAELERLYSEVMPLLSNMVAKRDQGGHCGLCASTCMKQALSTIGLNVASLRGMVLERVLNRIDAIGVPGETSLQWTLNLGT